MPISGGTCYVDGMQVNCSTAISLINMGAAYPSGRAGYYLEGQIFAFDYIERERATTDWNARWTDPQNSTPTSPNFSPPKSDPKKEFENCVGQADQAYKVGLNAIGITARQATLNYLNAYRPHMTVQDVNKTVFGAIWGLVVGGGTPTGAAIGGWGTSICVRGKNDYSVSR